MKRLKQLREKLSAVEASRQELADTIIDASRDATEDEAAKLAGFDSQIGMINAEIDKEVQRLERESQMSASAGRQSDPIDPGQGAEGRVEVGEDRRIHDPYGGYGPEDGREVSQQELRRIAGTFALDVRQARDGVPDRLANHQRIRMAAGDGMQTTIGHDGGYLLPTAVGGLLNDRALEQEVIAPRATSVPMTTQTIEFPAVDDTDHSGGTVFGGVQAYFAAEEAQLTASKPTLSKVTLALHKLTTLCYVSGEMLDWSPISVGTWLTTKMTQAMAWKRDDKYISGNGAAGEPLGLINAGCKIEVSKETGQAGATIVFENIVKMYARVWDQIGSLVWLANKTVLTQLPKLTAGDGTTAVPIFLPNMSAQGAPLQTLFGIPILFTEHCKALGTAGDLVLCNLGEYLVGDATDKMRAERNIGLKFDYDQTAFRVIQYTGGTPGWRSTFTPQNGDTLSPIVTLAARA